MRAETFTAAADLGDIPVSVVHPRRSDAAQNLNLPGNMQAFVETPIYARTNGYLQEVVRGYRRQGEGRRHAGLD